MRSTRRSWPTMTRLISNSTRSSWAASTDNVGVTNYYLFRSNAKYKLLGKVLSFTDTGLVTGRSYTYKLYALDAAGNWSGASANVSASAR